MTLVCFVAISASLPISWISLAKLLIFVSGLLYLITSQMKKQSDSVLETFWTPFVVISILLAFSFSLLWTSGDQDVALMALVKHSKLLEILLLIGLIRTKQEARLAITTFASAQAFLLLSSWLMAVGVPIPWTTSAGFKNVVFSTYLDQSIIFATTASVFWHLQKEQLFPRWLAVLLAIAALVNVFLLLEGRTGYAVALVVLSLSVMWAMPKRLRLVTLIGTPIIAVFILYFGSVQVQDRLSKVVHEVQNYGHEGSNESSSGWRLNAWYRSVQAMNESPWHGHGVGSWTMTVKRLEGSAATQVFGSAKASNPHQEYLLWGVELGILGTLLLISLIVSLIRDAMQFSTPIGRAMMSVVAAMAVACMFNSTLYDALIGDYFCITLGLLFALGARNTSITQKPIPSTPELKHLKAAA